MADDNSLATEAKLCMKIQERKKNRLYLYSVILPITHPAHTASLKTLENVFHKNMKRCKTSSLTKFDYKLCER